jgi:signal recognition particle subunit SRP54
MFNQLSDKFIDVLRNMRGQGKLSEKNLNDSVRAVKMALLEADVDYKVVKTFIKNVKERAMGQEVLRSILPDQQFVKIVHEELTELMGRSHVDLTKSSMGATLLMLVGIQGSGKTTSCGKLALFLKKKGSKVMLVACDVQRPAAIKQLKILSEQAGVDFYSEDQNKSPKDIALNALASVKHQNYDYIIFDTAGCIELNDTLMQGLINLKVAVKPHEVLFVADAMMGQSALTVALAFDEQVGLDGVILNKLDGDSRGGLALSVKSVLKKPIKFVGVGEKTTDLELFYPDRLASRILGMGDVVSLVEKAQGHIDEKEAARMEKKIRKEGFDLNDFLQQMQQIKKMGSFKDILAMMPGGNQMKNLPLDDKQIVKVEAIILSMTPYERSHPHAVIGNRRKRIAAGSGRELHEVNRMLKQFDMMNKMLKKIGKGGMIKKLASQFKGMPFG